MATGGGDPAAPGSPRSNASGSGGGKGEGGDGGAPAPAASPGKRPAWKKPANGAADVGSVMGGAVSWPALSEAAAASRHSPKSTASDASSTVASQGPVIAASSPKSVSNYNANSNSTQNLNFPVRHKSKRWDRGAANGGIVPLSSRVENQSDSGKQDSLSNVPSPREAFPNRGGGIGNDQPHGSYRRGNNGSHSRGGNGHYKNNHGNQHDQGRGRQEWNFSRNFCRRNVHLQQQQQPRPMGKNFMRPPPLPPFFTPPGYFVNPLGIPDMPSPIYYVHGPPPEALGGVTFLPHPNRPVFFSPVLDPGVRFRLMKQIEYYFSVENLITDEFLRLNMDEEGWVPISLIAGFNKVKEITTDIPFVLDTLQTSTEVEAQGDKVRKRYDWKNWPIPKTIVSSAHCSISPAGSNYDNLATKFNGMALGVTDNITKNIRGELIDTNAGALLSRTSSGECSHSVPNNQGAGQGSARASDDSGMPANKTNFC